LDGRTPAAYAQPRLGVAFCHVALRAYHRVVVAFVPALPLLVATDVDVHGEHDSAERDRIPRGIAAAPATCASATHCAG
jgi:hypothetical protein